MTDIILHGWAFSPFLRAVRIALHEKGVPHTVRELTPADTGAPAYRSMHAFGKIPVFEQGALRLTETIAILQYVDAAFPGPALQPIDAASRAKATALMLQAANYLYPVGVMGLFVQHAYVAANGGTPDKAKVAEAAAATAPLLDAFAAVGGAPWLLGDTFGLADILLGTMVANVAMTPDGARLIAERPALAAWHTAFGDRDSVRATVMPIPLFGLG